MRAFVLVLGLCVLPVDLHGQLQPPSGDSLAGISARGRLLAQYDRAAWQSTDAVVALNPGADEVRGYIARRVNDVWVVSFGKMSADGQAFLVAYEARQNRELSDSFSVVHHSTPRSDTGDLVRAARALDVACADFGTQPRPYNAAVLPAASGEWFVYMMPAQVRATVYPIGQDIRYRMSADGRSIIVKRRLHNTLAEFGNLVKPGSAMRAGVRTAVVDNVPEDTDVFHVIVRKPQVPEYIVTDEFVYRIDLDGSITLLGGRAEVLGRGLIQQ